MSLSKFTGLFRTSSLVLCQHNVNISRLASLRYYSTPRNWFFNKNKSKDFFVVEKDIETKGKKFTRGQFYSAVFISSTVLISSFVLIKWQLNDLLAKEDESKSEVGHKNKIY